VEKKSIASSPVFWGILGAVVVGGGVGAYFVLKPKEPTSASLGAGLACGDTPCR
jgi:hypothetical protein